MFDLTTSEGAEAYLEQTPFAASNVRPLTGGTANFTYRITLREPYTAPGLNVPVKTMVMKHAEPYIALLKEIPFDVERQRIEVLALKLVPELVGPLRVAGVPRILHEDYKSNVMLMTDSGPDSCTLKAVLQSSPLPDDIARTIGAALGIFIARLHTVTRNPAPGTPGHSAKEALATNDQGRTLMASFFYGSVVSSLTDPPPIVSPPLDLSSETLSKLNEFSQMTQEHVNTSNDVIVMGDFWTGNILTALEPQLQLTVIDWESVRSGFTGLDLGQLLAELHLIGVFHPESRACVGTIVSEFLNEYRAVILNDGERPEAQQRLVDTAYDSAGRIGVHFIVMAPKVPWGSSELMREVVREGVEYILRTVDRDEAWLRRSIVGGLWG